jgi:hypothetical protein
MRHAMALVRSSQRAIYRPGVSHVTLACSPYDTASIKSKMSRQEVTCKQVPAQHDSQQHAHVCCHPSFSARTSCGPSATYASPRCLSSPTPNPAATKRRPRNAWQTSLAQLKLST